MISLSSNIIDTKDINALCKWLKTGQQLTKGPLTIQFEESWSYYIGCKYSVFVNSGSSALLLMFASLSSENKKVVVPALSWATDFSSPYLLGYQPILCDCNFNDLSCDLDHLEEIFIKDKPAFLLLVYVLGLVPDMDKVINLCNKYNVILLEDCCESLGSIYKECKLGNLGLMSAFSFYYGHHVSTIEGGMICTNDKDLYEKLLMLRSHGWDRDLPTESQKILREKYNISSFEALFRFYEPAFNVRSTDLQAFIGLRQMKKISEIVNIRWNNFHEYKRCINGNILDLKLDHFVSLFAYPVVSKNRVNIVQKLKDNGVETRPLIAGCLSKHPFFIDRFGLMSYNNCDVIDEFGFYLPCHHDITFDQIRFISEIVNSES